MTKFEQIGVNIQHDSETKEIAKKNFSRSCECCCNKGLQIDCDRCAISTAHQLVLASFETKEKKRVVEIWKSSIKELAEDFCISQVKVNRVLKRVEQVYGQREREIPSYYKGNRDAFLYDKAQREMMNLLYA